MASAEYWLCKIEPALKSVGLTASRHGGNRTCKDCGPAIAPGGSQFWIAIDVKAKYDLAEKAELTRIDTRQAIMGMVTTALKSIKGVAWNG